MAKDDPNMRGPRSRDENGELRKKRNDTHVGTIENTYGLDFHVRSDMKLKTLLKKEDVPSLSKLVENSK